MTMKLELIDLNNGSVYVGDKLHVKTIYNFEDDTSISWSGIQLITRPPCLKEVQITKQEIFSKGNFEAGEYIREKNLLIKNNIVPTIKKRDLNYEIKLILRLPHPENPEENILIFKKKEIEIKPRNFNNQYKETNPISLSISGLSVNLSKDIFRPGETIKINYKAPDFKELEFRLLQKSNLTCYCETYGQSCKKVEELPAAIAGDVRTSNTSNGNAFLKVPEIAEPTHEYLWEPTEKESWGFKLGDYTKWSLLVLGKPKISRDLIKFEIPITIVASFISKMKKDSELFSKEPTKASDVFESMASRFQKIFEIKKIEPDGNKYLIRIKNISNKQLEGVSVRVSGLKEELFETAPFLRGFNIWGPGEEKELIYESKHKISAIIALFEDNQQNLIRLQYPLS